MGTKRIPRELAKAYKRLAHWARRVQELQSLRKAGKLPSQLAGKGWRVQTDTTAPEVQPTVAPAPLLLTAAEVARELSIGVRTLRRFDAAGRIPEPVRLGGRVAWSRDELAAWIAAGSPNRAEWNARKRAAGRGRP